MARGTGAKGDDGVTTDYLGFDRWRVAELGRRTVRAVAFFDCLRSSDPAAANAIAAAREIGSRMSTEWIPAIAAIVDDRSLFDWPRAGPGAGLPSTALVLDAPAFDPDEPSPTDLALAAISSRFGDLDRDGDSELSWGEILAGVAGDDAEVAAACTRLVDHPLAFANTALADADYSIDDLDGLSIDNLDDGGWDVEMSPYEAVPMWQFLTLSPRTIASAMEQNRHQRTLARPEVFFAADGADDDGEIDGRVSVGDLVALMGQTDDPAVIAMCQFFIGHEDAFKRIDRRSPHSDYDGRIAYDELWRLGRLQGSLTPLTDPS